MSRHVAVLMGGWSAERDVSLVSGREVTKALESKDYTVTTIDVGHDIAEVLAKLEPDVVFNALHGRWGEDGCIQGVCEILEIPYTHSGVLASSVAMDKPVTKQILQGVGIRCAEGRVVPREDVFKSDVMARPYVVKPTNEGSSVAVKIVMPGDNLAPEVAWESFDELMVERFIPGREITVAVMGESALGVTELRPKSGFYDYANKYTDGRTEHFCPAPIHLEAYQEALELAVLAHRTLKCRGISRTDFRYDDTDGEPGRIYFLEINTQPGLTPLSLVPELARHAGITFDALVDWIVEDAGCPR
jgi:D-alanine-D-alanine ligase